VNLNRIKKLPLTIAAFVACSLPTLATYAPIPAVEQGRLFTLYVGAGCYYDTNIFGAANGGINARITQAKKEARAKIARASRVI